MAYIVLELQIFNLAYFILKHSLLNFPNNFVILHKPITNSEMLLDVFDN